MQQQQQPAAAAARVTLTCRAMQAVVHVPWLYIATCVKIPASWTALPTAVRDTGSFTRCTCVPGLYAETSSGIAPGRQGARELPLLWPLLLPAPAGWWVQHDEHDGRVWLFPGSADSANV